MEEYQYHDPVTSFLKELYIEFDFEAAQRELTLAEEVVGNDFFLCDFKDEFLDNARYLISEAYCRIHQKIDIANLSERLNLSQEEGEKWIVNLIRETKMGADAKIDLEKVSFLPFSFFLFSFIHTHSPIFHSERHRNHPTTPAGLSKRHRKDSTTRCTHTSLGRCHRTFRPRCLHATAQPRATRPGGHCQLIMFSCWIRLVYPAGLFSRTSICSSSMLSFYVACSYQSFSKFHVD